MDVDGPSVLAIWHLFGDLRNLGGMTTSAGLMPVALFEVRLNVRTKYIGKTRFSFGERLSTAERLRRFRPELAPLFSVLATDVFRSSKR